MANNRYQRSTALMTNQERELLFLAAVDIWKNYPEQQRVFAELKSDVWNREHWFLQQYQQHYMQVIDGIVRKNIQRSWNLLNNRTAQRTHYPTTEQDIKKLVASIRTALRKKCNDVAARYQEMDERGVTELREFDNLCRVLGITDRWW